MYSDDSERLDHMKKDYPIETSNVRGGYVKNPGPLPFSFYFYSGHNSKQSIRAAPSFDPYKLKKSHTGVLKLSDDWKFVPGRNDINVSESNIQAMKRFFKEHIVLFVMVWDEFLQDGIVADYFEGRCTLNDVVQDLVFYPEFSYLFDACNTIKDLETVIRDNSALLTKAGYAVNFYGN